MNIITENIQYCPIKKRNYSCRFFFLKRESQLATSISFEVQCMDERTPQLVIKEGC